MAFPATGKTERCRHWKEKREKCDKSKTITTDMLLTSLQDSLIKNKKANSSDKHIELAQIFWLYDLTFRMYSTYIFKWNR